MPTKGLTGCSGKKGKHWKNRNPRNPGNPAGAKKLPSQTFAQKFERTIAAIQQEKGNLNHDSETNSNNQILNNCIGRVVVLWKDCSGIFTLLWFCIFNFSVCKFILHKNLLQIKREDLTCNRRTNDWNVYANLQFQFESSLIFLSPDKSEDPALEMMLV